MITQRSEFILLLQSGDISLSELCRSYGISRTTGYKWKKRFNEEGLRGLREKSRRPLSSKSEIPYEITTKVIAYRDAHPSWGATKIRKILLREFKKVPSRRTIHRILEDCNLITRRRRVGKSRTQTERIVLKATHINHVWTVDFKGWWRTKDGNKVFPLTIRDEYSKNILVVKMLPSPNLDLVKEAFQECFLRNGLPEVIRSDNGTPFSYSFGLCGLSRLSGWWLKLGITPNFIPPASPQYNAAHERMHRDMAKDLEARPARNLSDQQVIADGWREDYNFIRPHDALNDKTPSQVYKPSRRKYSLCEPALEYPSSMISRYVTFQGHCWLNGKRVFISKAIGGENIGLQFTDKYSAIVHFGHVPIALLNLNDNSLLEYNLITGKESNNKCAA